MQDTAFGCCVPSCNWIGNAAFQATKQQHVYAAAPISKAGQGRAGQGRAGQGRAGQGAKHAYTDEAREFEYSRLASIWLLFIC